MDNTGSGDGFLGGLSDIALGYLQTRANILLNNQAGGQVPTQYIGSGGGSAPSTLGAGSTLLHSPLLWIAAGGLLFVAVLLIAGKKK